MKSLLKFLGVLVVLFVWIELIDLSFSLMNQRDDLLFYGGLLTLMLLFFGPVIYYKDNILIFLKNMKGVFLDDEKKDKK
jgi:hypothetical protein